MANYRVKNWHKFQHFKDRRPPWVKLYRDILDDLEWHQLDGEAAKALVMLWLIASEYDGFLPSLKNLAFRLRLSEQKTKSLIDKLSHWLEQDDITPISCGYHNDAPETETEKETKTEVEKKGAAAPSDDLSWLPLTAWKEYQQHRREIGKPMKATGEAKTLKKLKDWHSQGFDLTAILGNSVANGYQGLFLPKGNGKNKQQMLEERNRQATSGWRPPEMRDEHAAK